MLAHHLLLFSLYLAPLAHPQGILDYFFGAGIGTNIGASIVWGFIAGFIGFFIAKKIRHAWAHLHSRIDMLHDYHEAHHEHLANIARRLDELHDKVDSVGDKDARNASTNQVHKHDESKG